MSVTSHGSAPCHVPGWLGRSQALTTTPPALNQQNHEQFQPTSFLSATLGPDIMPLPLPEKLFLPLLGSLFSSSVTSSEKGLPLLLNLNQPPYNPTPSALLFFWLSFKSLPLPEIISFMNVYSCLLCLWFASIRRWTPYWQGFYFIQNIPLAPRIGPSAQWVLNKYLINYIKTIL